jgi:hypothetical protein
LSDTLGRMSQTKPFREAGFRIVSVAAAVLACAAPVSAVSISNLTALTTIFRDNFESGTFSPSVGSWNVGPDVTVTNASTPGPAEGTFYARLFRDSNTFSQGNLRANFAPQTTAGDVILLRMMVYFNDNVDTRAQLMLDDGDFTTARAWVVPDGAGHVLAVGPGFVRTDTGLTYTTNTWQEWDLRYAIGAGTFSVSVNGLTASGFTSETSGAVNGADLFNGVPNPSGVFFLDAVPAAVGTPEPGGMVAVMIGLAGLAALRLARKVTLATSQ